MREKEDRRRLERHKRKRESGSFDLLMVTDEVPRDGHSPDTEEAQARRKRRKRLIDTER